MKQIPLTRGKVALVDDEDYDRLMAMGSWSFIKIGYARKGTGGRMNRKCLYMHRFILGLSAGDGFSVDHINGDKLDNRKRNLRICSQAENSRNAGLRKSNKSGFKGVSFQKSAGKFAAKLTLKNKDIYLGLFECPKEAAKAYNTAALKHFGEFAKLNQI